MNLISTNRRLTAVLILASAATASFAAEAPTSGPTSTVVYVGGNDLVVKSADGKLVSFTIPPSYRLTSGGKEVPVTALKPGASITKPITPGTTPRAIVSVKVVKGKVYMVTPPTGLTLALSDGNKEVTVPEGTTFTVSGKPVSLADLKPDTTVEATIITPVDSTAAAPAAPATPPMSGALLVAKSDSEAQADLPLAGTSLPAYGLAGITLLTLGGGLLLFGKKPRHA